MKDTEKNELLLKGLIANLDQELIKHYEKEAWSKVISQTTIGNNIKLNALQYYKDDSMANKKFMVRLSVNNIEFEITFDIEKYSLNPQAQIEEFISKLGALLVQSLVNSNAQLKADLTKALN